MPFGKYRGQPLSALPDGYLAWLTALPDLREPLRSRIRDELRARGTGRGTAPGTLVVPALRTAASRIVEAGFRALAKQHHPDAGGDHHAMIELTAARDALVALL